MSFVVVVCVAVDVVVKETYELSVSSILMFFWKFNDISKHVKNNLSEDKSQVNVIVVVVDFDKALTSA